MIYTRVHEYFGTTDEERMQRELRRLLASHGWDVERVAELMSVSRHTVYRTIRRSALSQRALVKARATQALQKLT